ncbi:hypothetical protein ACTNBL_09290 [Enterococcus villorum]|uniref:DUF2187 domain-containing protein n=2 Tax=Enterococcus villorum TaxID=112904 RepID=A0A511J0E0_9ENTE|nr:hypothetical protein [Enterococcus villorum]EOH87653.1 hypothetical protein UAO_02365 [Enterococcus villorum ATCC 700913]EOW77628.1 hypothetical protein I591_00481 [Enterococcus villorum ATCC 700913]GEL91464.1 hypothetical protein EVI01_08010 [Enterococcus villorum]
MLELEVGKSYICKPIGVNHEVIGCIERTYTNTAVIFVERYDQRDRLVIYDSKFRLLVKLSEIYTVAEAALVS